MKKKLIILSLIFTVFFCVANFTACNENQNVHTESSGSSSVKEDSSESSSNSSAEEENEYTKGLEYSLSYDENYYVVDGMGIATDSEIIIPASYKNLPVMEIDDWAFSDCKGLTSVIMSNNMRKIGLGAFDNCENLKNVVIPNSVHTIGEWAFDNCPIETIQLPTLAISSISKDNLKSIEITGGAEIKESEFEYCSSLTNVIISNSITNVGASAFSCCVSLMSVTIPNSVTSIGEYAFSSCKSLKRGSPYARNYR